MISNVEFISRVYNLVGDEYTFLEEYVNTKTNILVRHNSTLCNNNVYSVKPSNFLSKSRCNHPKCIALRLSINRKASLLIKPLTKNINNNTTFVKEVYNLVGDEYTFLEEYVNTKTNILVRHNSTLCNNNVYSVKPNKFLNGRRCNHSKCIALRLSTHSKINIKLKPIIPTKLNTTFVKEVYNLVGDEYTFLEEYITNNTKIKVCHNTCKYTYYVTPVSFLSNGRRCPDCDRKLKNVSKAGIAIANILKELNIDFERQIVFNDLKMFAYDFAIEINPELVVLLEYDGIQHSVGWNGRAESLKKQQKRDLIKNNFVLENNFLLIRIDHTQRNNLKNTLDKILNCFERSTTTCNGVPTKFMSGEIEGVTFICDSDIVSSI